MHKKDEELRRRLAQMLAAPKSKPLTIDKGHDRPIYTKKKKPKSA